MTAAHLVAATRGLAGARRKLSALAHLPAGLTADLSAHAMLHDRLARLCRADVASEAVASVLRDDVASSAASATASRGAAPPRAGGTPTTTTSGALRAPRVNDDAMRPPGPGSRPPGATRPASSAHARPAPRPSGDPVAWLGADAASIGRAAGVRVPDRPGSAAPVLDPVLDRGGHGTAGPRGGAPSLDRSDDRPRRDEPWPDDARERSTPSAGEPARLAREVPMTSATASSVAPGAMPPIPTRAGRDAAAGAPVGVRVDGLASLAERFARTADGDPVVHVGWDEPGGAGSPDGGRPPGAPAGEPVGASPWTVPGRTGELRPADARFDSALDGGARLQATFRALLEDVLVEEAVVDGIEVIP